jgi:large subunit ribosomal protein L28
MSRVCAITGRRRARGSHIWRSGKAKKKGGIGTHITAITKRWFNPNLQKVRVVLPSGEIKRIRVSVKAIKAGLITKAPPRRRWTKPAAKPAAA